MLLINKANIVNWAVGLLVSTALLAVVSDRIRVGVWTLDQIGAAVGYTAGIAVLIFLLLLLYSFYRYHMSLPPRRC